MKIILDGMPVPPTQNQIFATDFKTKRRFTSKVYSEYKAAVKHWASERGSLLFEIKRELAYYHNRSDYFRIAVHSYFCFPRNKINTMGDPSNRIKALHDAIVGLVSIDDRYFEVGRAANAITSSSPYAIIMMEPVARKSDIEIREEIQGWNQKAQSIF